ncbi:MAG: hypothetical protein Q8R44_08380 [Novosphingobium sp.]|nr:hypothetical protein [Novosphingobium sp.]
MKNLAMFAGLALLASCGSEAPAPEASAPADAAMPMDAAATPAAAGPTPGSYDVTGPDGTKLVATLMADGTYVDRDEAGKVLEKGKWAVKDGKTCFDDEGDKPEVCYTDSAPAADGSFSATAPDGKVTQVKPHAKM